MSENTTFFNHQLNESQRKAVAHSEGPLIVLAGAGSGKTRVLTYRAAELILRKKASAREILCVTFTNKAAQEMRERIESVLRGLGIVLSESLWVSTFHSFCVKVLRSYIQLMDYSPQFLIYNQTDQLNTVKNAMEELGLKKP